ncbi:nodulin-3-like [Trifolium pratense]|uniref:nodulin-3-like n=1 Tax=Trifolium pratense TaxID=57577 RepID=UPI001E691E4F|nr:nodulin-3-like [Trifolium pratense]
MQKRKTMAKIFKFVCAMILFLSLFIDAARYNPKLQNPKLRLSVSRLQECEYDDDCPQIVSSPLVIRCIDYNCIVVNH